jgi:hypothetical protein
MANPIQEAQALLQELDRRSAVRDQVLQNLRTLPQPMNPLQSGFNEAVNALTFDLTDLPTEGTLSPLLGRFAGSAGGVGLGILGGGLIGGVPGAIAGGALMGFGQGFGRGVDEQTDRGVPLDQVNYLGPTVQGGAEGILNALPPLKGASMLGTVGKNVLRGTAIGLPTSAISQYATTGTIDPMRTALDTAGFAGGEAVGGLLGGTKGVEIPGQAADTGVMAAARAKLQDNMRWIDQPDNITIDPRLYARKELTDIDNQLETLLARKPAPVDALPAVREVEATVKAVEPPTAPQPGPNGYIARETINAPIEQTFLNRSSAMRGARNLGLEKADVQPVQVGPGEWMIHKVDPASPKIESPTPKVETPATPKAGETVTAPEAALVDTPEPIRPPDNNATDLPGTTLQPVHSSPSKPPSVVQALRGLDPKEQTTVHDFDLSTVEPGTKIEGLGTFKGIDDGGLPIISRKGGLKRPGESGFAHDEESLGSVLAQAGDTLQPGDDEMLRQIMQDVQTGQATEFVGRAKQGRSADMATSADAPGTMAAFGTKTNDRVIGVYYKPATAKTPAQIVARVVNSLGEQATRVIREAGNPDIGFMRTGSGPHLEMHNPATVATVKRALASTADIQKAGIIRKTAMGSKHEANPIVQRIDEAIQANNVEKLNQALRDFDRLPADLQKQLGAQSGCVK